MLYPLCVVQVVRLESYKFQRVSYRAAHKPRDETGGGGDWTSCQDDYVLP